MDRPLVTVPRDLMRVTAVDWDIDWRERGASREATDGSQQLVIGGAPRWVGTAALALRPQDILRWRAIRDTARGRTGLYRIPMVDPIGFSATGLGSHGFSTGEPFSTGEGFADRPVLEAVAPSAAGATEVRVVSRAPAVPLKAGMFLSFGDWPVRITAVLTEGGVITLTVAPFLRTAIAEGELIDLEAFGIFEVPDGSGNPGYGLSRVSEPSLTLREWVNR